MIHEYCQVLLDVHLSRASPANIVSSRWWDISTYTQVFGLALLINMRCRISLPLYSDIRFHHFIVLCAVLSVPWSLHYCKESGYVYYHGRMLCISCHIAYMYCIEPRRRKFYIPLKISLHMDIFPGLGAQQDNMNTLQWRHNGRDGVLNHQPHNCFLTLLFTRRSKKTSKLRVTGLCEGNSPVTGEFPAQMASNEENVSIWWRHRESPITCRISL